MFFTATPEEGKIHLRLSEAAMLCIDSDRQTFSTTEQPLPLAGFINRVFSNYCRQAKASVDLQKKAMLRKKEAQRNAYAVAHHLTQQQLELLRQYDEELCNEEALHHGAALREQLKKAKGHTLKVRINCENMGYLFDSTSLCNEEDYYNGRAGLYIQAVLEEYCRLEYSQREKIYFPLPAVQTGKTLLEVCTSKGERKLIHPYEILAQALTPYNYLLGAAFEHAPQGDCWQPCSLRLRTIQQCREVPLPQHVTPPTEAIRKQCFALVEERGLSYLQYPCEEIRVQLTKPEGIQLYRKILWYRPTMQKVETETENHVVYRFFCSPLQARAYFMRFGSAAEVLSPLELRQDMGEFFHQAAQQYT